MTTGGTNQSFDIERAMESVAEDEAAGPHIPLRSRPSWVKRLSAFPLSGTSTPSSGSRPASASMSFSAGSTSFSQTGSMVPIFPNQQTQPLPPNKLVKRSSSIRASTTGIVHVQEVSSRPGRPLTTHQRLATLRARPSSSLGPADWSDGDRPLTREKQDRPKWRHYFVAKMIGGEPEKMPNGFAKDAQPIKRLFADEKCQPVLVMAESIVTTNVEVDERSSFRLSQDAESIMFGSSSRPMTPANFDEALTSPVSTAPSKRSRPEPSTPADEPVPRRSFSISDLLSRGPTSKKESRKTSSFGDRFLRRKNFRISSAPSKLMSAPTKESIELQHDRERPGKRRDITAPAPIGGPLPSPIAEHPPHFSLSAAAPVYPVATPSPSFSKNGSATLLADSNSTSTHQDISSPAEDSPTLTKRPQAHSSSHRVRHSIANSQTSTLANSDMEARGLSSGDDDDTDMTSDSMFDSVRTRGTRSTSGAGARGPRIETIFDESPPQKSIPKSFHDDQPTAKALADIDIEANSWKDDETISTPTEKAASLLPAGTPSRLHYDGNLQLSPHLPSSPPDISHMHLGQMRQHTDDDDMYWSYGDSEVDSVTEMSGVEEYGEMEERVATPLSLHRSNPTLVDTSSSSPVATPSQLVPPSSQSRPNSGARSSIFDWGERSESPGNRSPPRPKTVHGKKQPGRPGSRTVGRRAPSALHARSQSVPVVPDVEGKRDTSPRNKFGTWGAGNIPTEEWDDDFDFQEPKDLRDAVEEEQIRVDSGKGMLVPQSIRDRQRAVIHNGTLLREWTYYIRVLKDVRQRAVLLDMLDGDHADTFRQIDAVITLADVDEKAQDRKTQPSKGSPPSSPGFDADAFEDEPGAAHLDRMRRKAARSTSGRLSEPIMHASGNGRHRRKSVLPPNDGIFSPPTPASNSAITEQGSSPAPSSILQETPTRSRPRKDSEALARVVIERFQNKDSSQHAGEASDPEEPKNKVPFDTTTLRHIVPYVRKLADEAKEAVRRTEGLYSSPNNSPKPRSEPEFNKIFRELQPDNSPLSRRRRRLSRTSKSIRANDENTRPIADHEISAQMDQMTIA